LTYSTRSLQRLSLRQAEYTQLTNVQRLRNITQFLAEWPDADVHSRRINLLHRRPSAKCQVYVKLLPNGESVPLSE
jgi:hypothetical protein